MVTADQELASPASPGNHPALATTSLYVNDPAANAQFKYPNNYISTRRYNILTFIPLNLFEQFRKISNFYFLVNAIIGLIPGISSISPYSAVVPLVFVVGVAMIKDGYEDYMRYKSDEAANAAPCWVLRSGSYVQVPSKNVLVGDVVRVDMGDSINADLLLLASTAPEGAAYIETSNLDGETNVKNRKALEATLDFLDPVVIERAKVSIHCDQPSPALLSWHGVLTLDGHEYAVGLDQFLYRSATLRNTQNAYGVVVYAGAHTKMYLNLQQKASKVSALTRKLNYLIIGALLIQQILLIIMSGYAVSFNKTHGNHWYIAPFLADQGSGARLFFLRYLSYFLLISYLIPISLFVTLELCKVAQATLMAWDQHMMEYMDGKWQTCRVNNSDVSEELAQVSYIFTDKTGTLTENCMKFYQGDILGTRIGVGITEAFSYPPNTDVQRYFRLLSLCNTIQPFQNEKDPSGLQYEGQSPDEIALVHTAAGYGYRLIERTSKALVIEDHGQRLKYTILATLEFTADRKMMSIIVREPDTGRIMLLTKGADTNVMAQLSTTDNTNTSRMNSTNRTLIDMASQGLRTLVLAQREMSESEFKEWYAQFEEAGKALTNRSQEVDTVCLRAERDLTLVGITAIEDKLQDQVPETLQFFLDAGVVIWMLTGDKRETALTIAATSKLVDPQNDFVQHIDVSNIDNNNKSQRASALQNQLGIAKRAVDRAAQRVTIVVDGISLTSIQELCSELFVDVAQGVNSAVCCRLTPLQKANIVAMFQKTTGKVALAIGDGANDVSMIQEGRVGVGIVGLEGAQASRAADYAIPRFKHLRRLCAVHGRYSLYRNTMCIFVSFYKNILLSLLQFYFAFYNGASTQSLIDGWSLSFFNFAFLSWPPLLIGFFEKDVNESCVVSDPMLYRPLSRGKYFNWRYGSIWFGEAVLQSIFVFFIISTFTEVYNDIAIVGITHMTIVVTLSLLKIFLHLRYNTIIQVVGIVGSFGIYILFLVVYSAIPNLFGQSAFYFVGYRIHAHVAYWINVMTLAGGFLLMFDIPALGLIRSWFTPYRKSSVREKRITTSQLAKDLDPKMQSHANHPHS